MKLNELQPLFGQGGWREQRAHIFRTEVACRWFLRHHKQELVDCGALVVNGKRFLADPQVMDEACLAIFKRKAQAAAQGAPA